MLKSKNFVNTAIYLNVTAIIAARISVGNDIELMQTASAGEGKERTISGTFEDNTLIEKTEDNWVLYEILMNHKNIIYSQIDLLIREKKHYVNKNHFFKCLF